MILHNATPKPLFAFIFAAATVCAAPSYAETNETLMPKGMWKDPATGLIWDRCKLGQKWDGVTCIPRRPIKNILDLNGMSQYYWGQVANEVKQSNVGGYTDWELPNIVQLHSLLRCDKGFSH